MFEAVIQWDSIKQPSNTASDHTSLNIRDNAPNNSFNKASATPPYNPANNFTNVGAFDETSNSVKLLQEKVGRVVGCLNLMRFSKFHFEVSTFRIWNNVNNLIFINEFRWISKLGEKFFCMLFFMNKMMMEVIVVVKMPRKIRAII